MFSVIFSAFFAAALAAVVPRDATTSSVWPACQSDLSCTFAAIEGSSLADRLAYVRMMQSQFFGPRLGCPNQWRNIEGVIQFFIEKRLGASGTWVSYTDAGIVEAVQRGGAIALGMSSETGGNPGSQLWASYMIGVNTGTLTDRAEHDRVWSIAEQASTDYGARRGEELGKQPDKQTRRWFQFTQIYRGLMRNEGAIVGIVSILELGGFLKLPAGVSVNAFILWFFDVTNPRPAYCGASAAWDVSGLDGVSIDPGRVFENLLILALVIPKFVDCFIRYR